MYDLLIIGAGPAGITASIYAKRANLKVAVFEKNVPGGQLVNTAEIENYPGYKKLPGFELALNMLSHMEDLGVELIYDEVIDIINKGKTKDVITKDKTYETKAILVATGTIPRRLGVLNEEELAFNGISWCAICDGPLYKNLDVAVIGGGNSAVEEATYLASLANKVTLIQDLDYLTADKKAIDILKNASNVEFYLGAKVTRFEKADNDLIGVIINTKDNKEIKIAVNGVFEYIGLIPVTAMLKNLDILDKQGYIIANEKMETSINGIYGAGDCISKQIRQVVTATADGAIAVTNIIKYLESLK